MFAWMALNDSHKNGLIMTYEKCLCEFSSSVEGAGRVLYFSIRSASKRLKDGAVSTEKITCPPPPLSCLSDLCYGK